MTRLPRLISCLLLLATLTSSPAALPPTLLKEIGIAINYNASSPGQFTALGNTGTVVFFARTTTDTLSLCRTDGLATGTSVVMSFPSPAAAPVPAIGEIAALGNEAFFFKAGSNSQWELWKTNGTAAGTTLVKAVVAASSSGSFQGLPNQLTPLPGHLVFAAPSTAHGTELWTTDGTESGTILLRDIAPGLAEGSPEPLSSYPFSLAACGTSVFFTADDGTTGGEPWKTDGTPAGTVPLIDLKPGLGSSFAGGYTFSNGLTWFTAFGTGTFGDPPEEFLTQDVWRTDGTAAGTLRLLQLNQEDSIGGFVSVGPSTVFCKAHRYTAGLGGAISEIPGQFFTSDGTPAGTTGYGASNNNTLSPNGILGVLPGGTIIFNARGDGLFPNTTGRIALLTNGGMTELLHGNLQTSAIHGGSFYVVVSRRFLPDTLYKYTPSAPLDDRLTMLTTASGLRLTSAGGLLLASYPGPSNQPTGIEPYRVNPNGVITLLADLFPGSIDYPTLDGPYHSVASFLHRPEILNGTLVFPAEGPDGLELWRSDGTAGGTTVLRDLVPGPGGHRVNGFPVDAPGFSKGIRSGGKFFFTRYLSPPDYGYELWSTDGTTSGSTLVLASQNGAFDSMQPSTQGVWWIDREFTPDGDRFMLWTSDGTPGGTRAVKETGMTPQSYLPSVSLAGTTYAIMNTTGDEDTPWLWSISPDPTRTQPLFRFEEPDEGANAYIRSLTPMNGALYIFLIRSEYRSGGSTFAEIWRMIPGSLPQLLFTMPEPGSTSDFGSILAGRTQLFFNSTYGTRRTPEGESVTRLWVTDGTPAGTRLAAPPNSPLILQPDARSCIAGDRLFIIQNADAAGFEVWTCDATPAGTRRLSGSIPTAEFLPNGGLADNLTTGGDGYVYFDNETVENDLRVRRFWRVSATNPGAPEPFGDLPYNAVNVFGGTTLPRAVFWAHGRLYASCYSSASGHEFFWWPAPAAPTPFSTWTTSRGLTLGAADPLADPDQDGQPNLLEYLAGTLPDNSASLAPPTVAPQVFSASTQATLTFRRMESSGLSLVVESSVDGITWQADNLIAPDGTLTAQNGRRSALFSRSGTNPEFISIVTLPAGARPKTFLRVRATLP